MEIEVLETSKTNRWFIAKDFLKIFLPFATLIIGISILVYYSQVRNERIIIEDCEKNAVALTGKTIVKEFDSLVSDLKILSKNKHLQNFLHTGEYAHREVLSEEFLLYCENKRLYDQMRFLDETGMEILRINFNNGWPDIVPEDQLQNKSSRYYFKDTFKVERGGIFVSPFDLNIEKGEIEKPLKPMIRFGTPIFDINGQKRGVVILNYLGVKLINDLDNLDDISPGQIALLNSDGFWLKGTKPEDEWGFMYKDGSNHRFGTIYPEAWQRIQKTDHGQFKLFGELYTYTTVFPLALAHKSSAGSGRAFEPSDASITGKDYYWKVVSRVSPDLLNAESREHFGRLVFLDLFMVLVLMIVSLSLGRANRYRKRAEEVLQKAHDELEMRVEERTAELAKANEALHVKITEHKWMAEALRESEKNIRDLIENLPAGVSVSSPGGVLLEANLTALKIFGYDSKEDFLKIPASSLYYAQKERERFIELHGNGLAKNFETQLIRKDGTVFWSSITSISQIVATGETQYYNIIQDITERKQAEEELLESEKKYRSIMESMNDAVYICSPDFRVEYMNPSMIKRTGRDATGEYCFKAVHGLEEKCPWCVHHIVQQGEHCETDIVSQKENRSYHISHSPLVREDGSIAKMTIYRDTTELKKMETQLRQAQKMEAIGTLAGGIAHDFNNILFPIFGYLQMMLADVSEDDPLHDYLVEVFNASKRARDLVRQILTFSRQTEHEMKPLKVQLVIKEVLKLIRSSLPTTIRIRQNISNDCGLVMADLTQIHQVAMNLITNAYHAMEETGGTLTVVQKVVELAAEDLKDPAMISGPHVCLTVTDTGSGMDQGVIARIFEPYYTTKEAHKGTGLGLAVVHGIVKSHGGHIDVYSKPGKGTEFNVYLPVIKSQETVQKVETDS